MLHQSFARALSLHTPEQLKKGLKVAEANVDGNIAAPLPIQLPKTNLDIPNKEAFIEGVLSTPRKELARSIGITDTSQPLAPSIPLSARASHLRTVGLRPAHTSPPPNPSAYQQVNPPNDIIYIISQIAWIYCRKKTLQKYAPWLSPDQLNAAKRVTDLSIPAAFRILDVDQQNEPELEELFIKLATARSPKELIASEPVKYGVFMNPDSEGGHSGQIREILIRVYNNTYLPLNAIELYNRLTANRAFWGAGTTGWRQSALDEAKKDGG
ncbi:hypothetical protein GGR51DRAFT_496758 [Nemania sp. FL0031]|nr:hypothetical protein GGR51DRAFT_496758 [Nemania sp. FL0031]